MSGASYSSRVKAFGRVNVAGNIVGDVYGIASTAKVGTGIFEITFSRPRKSTTKYVLSATLVGTSPGSVNCAAPASLTVVTVYTYDPAGVLADRTFTLACFEL